MEVKPKKIARKSTNAARHKKAKKEKVKLNKLERVIEKRAEKIIRMACQEFSPSKKSF